MNLKSVDLSANVEKRLLPPGWRRVRLGDVIRDAQGGFACGERDSKGVIQLRMNNVTNRGQFDWSSFIRVPADSQTVETYRLRPGDVLFNNTNSTDLVGKTALFEAYKEPVVFSNHFTRIRTLSDKLSPAYLALWLQTQWQQRVFANICNRWIGQSAVQRNKLLAFEVPFPPLPEQKRIVAILAEQMAAVKLARAAAEAQLEAAKALPAAYLRFVFNSPEAQQWTRKRLGDVCEITARQVDPKIPEFGALPHVNGENIESGMCRVTYLKTAAENGMISGKYIFEPGDVLYSKLRPYLRKAVVADFRGVCSADMYPVRVNKQILDPHFLGWMLVSDAFSKYADEESRRARMPKLNREQLFAWEAPIPPISEQRRLMAILGNQIRSVERTRKVLKEQLSAINALPAVLLRRAFNGELTQRRTTTVQPKLPKGIFFKRAAIASYIINRLHKQSTFGRVQFEKVLYLTEAHVGIDLAGHYKREAAGPLDSDFLYKLESLAGKQRWFTKRQRGAEGFFYRPGSSISDRLGAAETILGDRRKEMDRLLDLFEDMDTEQAEVLATLFAAWNDFLQDGLQPTDEQIVQEVRERWHSAKERFATNRLQAVLNWMREHKITPRGIGPRTEVTNGQA